MFDQQPVDIFRFLLFLYLFFWLTVCKPILTVSLTDFPWLHGPIGRAEVQQLIDDNGNREGLFLVRESTRVPGSYVLSCVALGTVQHYIIQVCLQQPFHEQLCASCLLTLFPLNFFIFFLVFINSYDDIHQLAARPLRTYLLCFDC